MLYTLCSLDRLCGVIDVYNYIIRVVNILTFIYLETCCKLISPLHVTFSSWSLYKQQPQQYDTNHIKVHHISEFAGFINHMDLSNHWSSCDQAQGRSQEGDCCYRYPENAKSMCHICTHLNATEATQFSGSGYFQVCLPAPLSSCLFLPMTFRLALIVRLYLP